MPVTRSLLIKAIKCAAQVPAARINLRQAVGQIRESAIDGLVRECGQFRFDEAIDQRIESGVLEPTCTDAVLTVACNLWTYSEQISLDDFDALTPAAIRQEHAEFINKVYRALLGDSVFAAAVVAAHPEMQAELGRVQRMTNCGACKGRLYCAITMRTYSLAHLAELHGGTIHDAEWLESYANAGDGTVPIPTRKQNGAGEVIVCNDNEDAYKDKMLEISELYYYRSANIVHGAPEEGKMQIWLA